MRARSGNRLRDDGDGDRLRLLESGRGACHCGNRDREPATKRRSSKGNHSACAAAGPGRTRLLLSSRAGKRRFNRQKTLAREDEDGAATAASKISVAYFSAPLLQNERPRKETGQKPHRSARVAPLNPESITDRDSKSDAIIIVVKRQSAVGVELLEIINQAGFEPKPDVVVQGKTGAVQQIMPRRKSAGIFIL